MDGRFLFDVFLNSNLKLTLDEERIVNQLLDKGLINKLSDLFKLDEGILRKTPLVFTTKTANDLLEKISSIKQNANIKSVLTTLGFLSSDLKEFERFCFHLGKLSNLVFINEMILKKLLFKERLINEYGSFILKVNTPEMIDDIVEVFGDLELEELDFGHIKPMISWLVVLKEQSTLFPETSSRTNTFRVQFHGLTDVKNACASSFNNRVAFSVIQNELYFKRKYVKQFDDFYKQLVE